MAEIFSDVIKELIGFIREFFAIIHYFSDFMAIIELYMLIYENGAVGRVIVWLLVALVSAVIAELLKSHLPTPLRIILRRRRSSTSILTR